MVAKNRPLEAVKDGEEAKPAAKPAAKSAATKDITLPALSTFDKVTHPEIVKTFTRPIKKSPEADPRVFSAKGEKADACVRVIFAEQGFTRQQIADIVGCSASRVTEILWAIEATHASSDGSWEVPAVPRQSRKKDEDA